MNGQLCMRKWEPAPWKHQGGRCTNKILEPKPYWPETGQAHMTWMPCAVALVTLWVTFVILRSKSAVTDGSDANAGISPGQERTGRACAPCQAARVLLGYLRQGREEGSNWTSSPTTRKRKQWRERRLPARSQMVRKWINSGQDQFGVSV